MARYFALTVFVLGVLFAASSNAVAGTITYSYDQNNRLTGVNFNNQATASYQYDQAHNLTEYQLVTDTSLLKPFLLILSSLFNQIGDDNG